MVMQISTLAGVALPKYPSVGRKVAKGRRKHFTGQLILERGGQEILADVESHTEMQWALVFAARREVVDIETQVRFDWTHHEGKKKKHFFDFRISMHDGTRVAAFVKAAKRLESARMLRWLEAIAAQVPSEFADRVVVLTEAHLDPIEVHNAEFLDEVRESVPEVDARARREIQHLKGAVRIRDLVSATAAGGQGIRAVARLIRTNELELVHHVRIDHDALVRRPTDV
jgi:hypothetical protein